MAFVRLAFFPGASLAHFEALAEAMHEAPDPPGRLLFAAGPVEGGWQVVQVWTSQEQLADFNSAHFLPAVRALGNRAFPAAPVVTDLVPAVLTGSTVGRPGSPGGHDVEPDQPFGAGRVNPAGSAGSTPS